MSSGLASSRAANSLGAAPRKEDEVRRRNLAAELAPLRESAEVRTPAERPGPGLAIPARDAGSSRPAPGTPPAWPAEGYSPGTAPPPNPAEAEAPPRTSRPFGDPAWAPAPSQIRSSRGPGTAAHDPTLRTRPYRQTRQRLKTGSANRASRARGSGRRWNSAGGMSPGAPDPPPT